jgi:hypothetical protein
MARKNGPRQANPIRACHAHNNRGQPCKYGAMPGQSICRFHGGLAPQNLKTARERLNDLVDPAINQLRGLLTNRSPVIRLHAVKDVLDRTGYKPTEKVVTDGHVVVQIEMVDRAAPKVIDVPKALE